MDKAQDIRNSMCNIPPSESFAMTYLLESTRVLREILLLKRDKITGGRRRLRNDENS
jgi:hypothetical protein